MIGKFFRWFGYKIDRHMNESEYEPAQRKTRAIPSTSTSIDRSLGDHRQTMNLQIHSASGGYVLEFSKYDRKRDEHERNLHIITEQEQLGEAIAKIITVEMLRN